METVVPRPFILRRLHSLTGLWFLLFLIEHLFTNSQAALWAGERGAGFIKGVNFLHNLPYLQVIEVFLLGVPIVFHAVWGIRSALQAKRNDRGGGGIKPSLKEYGRNRAYSWQRITSYFLLVMLIFHVVRFRFIEYPQEVTGFSCHRYFVALSYDPGLYSVATRMHVQLYDQAMVQAKIAKAPSDADIHTLQEAKSHFLMQGQHYDPKLISLSAELESGLYEKKVACLLERFMTKQQNALPQTIWVAECPDFGTATLLTVRDTFKNKLYASLYTLFVLAAVFHGCNGFWTFLITWGLILKKSAQKAMVSLSLGMILILGFLGMAAIWGSYYLTLKP